jgi:hypothetical protein
MLPSSSLVKGIALVLCLLGTTGDPLEQILGHREQSEKPSCGRAHLRAIDGAEWLRRGLRTHAVDRKGAHIASSATKDHLE